MKLPTVESAMTTLKTVSEIVLGNNKDGTPRSLFDARLTWDQQQAKIEKKHRKRAEKMLRRWRRY